MRALIVLAMIAMPALGEEVVALRTLRPGTVLQAGDIRGPEATVSGMIGLEVRRAVYANRAVSAADLGPETLVRRNQIVQMLYRSGGLTIRTEGRALDGGGMGERVRVMNLTSRHKVLATVQRRGFVEVAQ